MIQAVSVSGTVWVPVRSHQETFAMQPQTSAYGRIEPDDDRLSAVSAVIQ